ncbi:DUF4190 domain-containing protein [Streptomyces cavernicola]|uniref:DUF4190 domain-containing protein n=1 Tax=Streptomyces cavernicola TaxID=3043613 RepID=A0ABT6SIY4_9ACTN|nr:DUF4190 domain-containing protein [Streptomyces sp. B-S-A6]MDI3408156.1 DUF4190 domain-containing protein [Streptomyces sp. B-S-A6]
MSYGYPQPPAPAPAAPQGGNGLAVAGLVLGIIGLVVSLIPVLNVVVWPLAILAVIFGGVGLARSSKVGKGKGAAITGLVTGILSVIMFFVINAAFVGAVDEAAKNIDKDIQREQQSQEADNRRAADKDVEITSCAVKDTEFGGQELDVSLKVTNNGDDRASYFIEGEVTDQDGNQVTTINSVVSDLNHGSSKKENSVALAFGDDLKGVTKTTCKILDVDRNAVLQ